MERMGGVFFKSAMRSGLFSQDFALSLRKGNFSDQGSKGASPPTWTGNVLLETPLLKPIPSGRQPRKPQPRRVTIIVLTHIRHDVQDSFSHEPILAGVWASKEAIVHIDLQNSQRLQKKTNFLYFDAGDLNYNQVISKKKLTQKLFRLYYR